MNHVLWAYEHRSRARDFQNEVARYRLRAQVRTARQQPSQPEVRATETILAGQLAMLATR